MQDNESLDIDLNYYLVIINKKIHKEALDLLYNIILVCACLQPHWYYPFAYFFCNQDITVILFKLKFIWRDI